MRLLPQDSNLIRPVSRERVVVSNVFLPENQLGTDPTQPVVGRWTATPAAGPPLEAEGHDTSKNRRRESNPPATVPGGPPPVRWLRQPHAQCPRQESRTKGDRSIFPVRPHTASAVGSPPGRSPGGDAVCLTSRQCPRQESNLVYDLRKVACAPAHSKDIHQHPTEESNLVRRLRTPSCVPHTRRARREPRSPDRTHTRQQSLELQVPDSNRTGRPYENQLGTRPPAVTWGRFELPMP